MSDTPLSGPSVWKPGQPIPKGMHIPWSQNMVKIRQPVARCHAHIANVLVDALHKLTTELVMRFDVIAIEDLNVDGMLKNYHEPLRIGALVNSVVSWNIKRPATARRIIRTTPGNFFNEFGPEL